MTIDQWHRERAEATERVARATAGFPKPYRRERPRDPEEARLLRERDTPEHLIGPSPPPPKTGADT